MSNGLTTIWQFTTPGGLTTTELRKDVVPAPSPKAAATSAARPEPGTQLSATVTSWRRSSPLALKIAHPSAARLPLKVVLTIVGVLSVTDRGVDEEPTALPPAEAVIGRVVHERAVHDLRSTRWIPRNAARRHAARDCAPA